MSADAAGTADVPTSALDAVLLKSVDMPEGTPTVKGYDFEGTLDLQALLDSMLTSGFQATQFGYAVDEVNKMLKWRLSDEPVPEDANEEERDPAYRAGVRTKIFLGFTSNLISSGVREQLKFLMKHKMVDVLVTTAGEWRRISSRRSPRPISAISPSRARRSALRVSTALATCWCPTTTTASSRTG